MVATAGGFDKVSFAIHRDACPIQASSNDDKTGAQPISQPDHDEADLDVLLESVSGDLRKIVAIANITTSTAQSLISQRGRPICVSSRSLGCTRRIQFLALRILTRRTIEYGEDSMKHMHRVAALSSMIFAILLLCGQSSAEHPDRTLSTGVTGMITSRGFENPQYVLTRQRVGKLILDIADRQISPGEARQSLSGGVIELQHLLDLQLLRVEDDILRLNYLVLTREDRLRIRNAAERFGYDLARAFHMRAGEFEALLADYPERLRADLRFVLVAGFVLNWEGLEITTELGLRAEARTWPNGDHYIIHSSEYGKELPLRGLYWGSHTYPGSEYSLTTLGDGPSQPRAGLPDVVESFATGLDAYGDDAEVHGASVDLLLAYMVPALDYAGAIMAATAQTPRTIGELAEQFDLEPQQLSALVAFLEAASYVTRDDDDRLTVEVVVLTAQDQELVDAALLLGREIVRDWMRTNYAGMEAELSDLTPSRHGLPFKLAFSEVWHDVFGVAAREMAQSKFIRDPYGSESGFEGFVPFVWESSLYER